MAKVRVRKINRRLKAALAYAKCGRHVVIQCAPKGDGCACGDPNCNSPGKHPYGPLAPQGLYNATTDETVINKWWKRYPDGNVAIRTGKESGIFVLDVDVRHGGAESLAGLIEEHGPLPVTLTVRSGGGGVHYYFNYPEVSIENSLSTIGPGLDIKRDGGLITTVPSLHSSGRQYEWEEGKGPDDIPLADSPPWLLKLIKKCSKGPAAFLENAGGDRVVREGSRNIYLFVRGIRLVRSKLHPETVRAAVKSENTLVCRPPIEDDEVEGIIKNAMAAADTDDNIQAIMAPHHLGGYILRHHFRIDGEYTLRFYRGQWWSWEDSHYRLILEPELQATVTGLIHSTLDDLAIERGVTKTLVMNVMLAMSSLCVVTDKKTIPEWIGEGDRTGKGDLLAMANGLLDLEGALKGRTKVLHKPTPAWFSLTHWPFEYDPQAKCPRWIRFLQQVQPDREVRALLQEFVGYCLTFDTSYHKFLVLRGEGANGKSVFTEVVTQVLGPENVTHVGLERFTDRFALAPTIGKLANVVSEVGYTNHAAEDMFKAAVTGDRIQVEFKHKDSFNAEPTARFIFATNETPRFGDRSGGLWRRMILVDFPVTIAEDKQDRRLAKRIVQHELPGVFNWALQGLARLRRRESFGIPGSVRQLVAQHQAESNPAKQFLKENYQEDPNGRVPCKVLYAKFKVWGEAGGHHVVNENLFGREVRRVFPKVERKQRRLSDTDRPYDYVGIVRRR